MSELVMDGRKVEGGMAWTDGRGGLGGVSSRFAWGCGCTTRPSPWSPARQHRAQVQWWRGRVSVGRFLRRPPDEVVGRRRA